MLAWLRAGWLYVSIGALAACQVIGGFADFAPAQVDAGDAPTNDSGPDTGSGVVPDEDAGWYPSAIARWSFDDEGRQLTDVSGNGQLDLLVFHLDNPGGDNHGYYRIGWNLNAAGTPTGGWSSVVPVPGWFGWENQGAGVALGDTNGNGRLDLVAFHLDNPAGENHGHYRIGRDLNTNGLVTGGWSNVIALPGWFGAEDQGAGVALANIGGAGARESLTNRAKRLACGASAPLSHNPPLPAAQRRFFINARFAAASSLSCSGPTSGYFRSSEWSVSMTAA